MADDYDAIVVGSGFGGGVSACRLAEAGLRVCVLERGRRFTPTDFIDDPDDAPRLLFHPRLNRDGLFDVRLMRDVAVITAAGVGGGSLVYANVQLRAPTDVFDERWPASITRQALDPYYDRTEEALDPRPTPAEPALRKVAAFAQVAHDAGWEAKPLPIAVHFGAARKHPFSGAPQQGCQNLGRCDIGCPIDAKNTVELTWIRRAEQFGAQVLPHRLVTGLRAVGGRWEVDVRDLAGGRRESLSAPTVVLAAGTLGSTRLLLQNRKALPRLSPALGSRFSGNGDALAVAFDPTAPGTEGAANDVGPVMTSLVDLTAERRLIVADGGLPPHFHGLLDVARGVHAIDGWRRWLLRASDAMVHLGFSDLPLRPRHLPPPTQRTNADALIYLMMGRDAADGQMHLTRLFRRLDVRWSKAGSAELFDDLARTAAEIGAAAHGDMFSALDGGLASKFTTVHPLGGCPMSDDPARGVVDDHGAVHGHPGLHVLDGSIIPTALGVNPSKTIAALAERGAEHLVAALT